MARPLAATRPAEDLNDIEQLLREAPEAVTRQRLEDGLESEWSGKVAGWTSPEAERRGANRIEHTHLRRHLLYTPQGEGRYVDLADVSVCLENGLSLRCPVCNSKHADDGPNACAAQPRRKYMPCPICQKHGRETRIYEERVLDTAPAAAADDPDYVAPMVPDEQERMTRLQSRLHTHMTAFHEQEALESYGLRAAASRRAR